MPLPARVKGYIKDASGAGIVGATATCGGISTQTVAGGAYLLTVSATGAQTVTGSMAGKAAVSVPVTLTAGGVAAAPLITLA